jgi:anti-sigma regulatory factor (Ser/Thr protein kinase)
MQQEEARRKERHVICHDLRNKTLKGSGGVRWGVNVVYSPHDIMCGDGYSVRSLFDGRQLIYVVDAMGSGMSASMTAMLTTSFFNYQVENLHLWENFTLRHFLKRFQEYLSSMLLEEEVLSCGFFLMDLVNEEIETAIFALPPMLLRGMDGSVRKIRGENPPLGSFLCDVKISTISLSGIADLLVMTDGVSDALLTNGGSYREVIEDDFSTAPTIASLQRLFNGQTVQGKQDDLTLMHLLRLDLDSEWSWRSEPELTLAGLNSTIFEFLKELTGEVDISLVERDELEVVLTEALMNAFEHGCLCIDRDEKTSLQLVGEYDTALESKTPLPDAGIVLTATLWRCAKKPLLIMEVQDSGPGVPVDVLGDDVDNTSVNGRGLWMIRHYSDFVFVSEPGGDLIVLKTLNEGEENAD